MYFKYNYFDFNKNCNNKCRISHNLNNELVYFTYFRYLSCRGPT